MPKRSPYVARGPADTAPRLPADLDKVELLKAGRRYYRDPVTAGLRLRVSNRARSWVYVGRVKGKPRRVRLGTYPRMTLDAARIAAMRINDAGAVGTPLTFAQLRAQYLDSTRFRALAERTQTSYRNVLEGRWYSGISSKKLREIDRRDLLGIRDAVARAGLVYSNVLRPALALFGWALDEGIIGTNPAVRLHLPQNEADPHPFTDAEVSAMMRALPKIAEPYRTLTLLVALTGQRPATWCAARWTEVNTQTGTLTVARSRGRKSKLGRGWSIPLCGRAVAALKTLKKMQGRHINEFVFGRALVVEQKTRDRIAKAAGMTDASSRGSLHRFRATMLSKLTEWQVPVETQLALAGHSNPRLGSRRHYVVPDPTAQDRAIAERYAEHIAFCELL